MLTVAIPKRNKLQNIIVLTPKDGSAPCKTRYKRGQTKALKLILAFPYGTCLSELS